METIRVGELVAEFMEQVEQTYGEDAEVEDAIVLAAIRVPSEDGEGVRQHTSVRCTSDSPVIQAGLLAWGKDAIMAPDSE